MTRDWRSAESGFLPRPGINHDPPSPSSPKHIRPEKIIVVEKVVKITKNHMEIGSKRELIIQNIKFRFCKSNGHPCPIHTCSVLRLSASWWENLREHSPDY